MKYQVQIAITDKGQITTTLRRKVESAPDAIAAAIEARDALIAEEKMQEKDRYQLKVSLI